jgi:hypothetical protein
MIMAKFTNNFEAQLQVTWAVTRQCSESVSHVQ